MTDIGMTRIITDASCEYQSIDDVGGTPSLSVYTSDNTLLEINENIDELVCVLDSTLSSITDQESPGGAIK